MGAYTTLFYRKESGEEPAKDFLVNLDYSMRAKMIRMLMMLQNNGPAIRMPYSEELEDGIFELRAKVGTDISRMLYFYDNNKIVILTNGFVKKSQKTPPGEIATARKYRADYMSRKDEL